MRRIALISCSAEKLSRMAPARQLYRSPLFRKSVAWVESQGLEWFVISALYGLIKPDEQLLPYNHTMRDKRPDERKAWADRIARELDAWTLDDERVEIVLLAGEAYAGWIPQVQSWCSVEQPLRGLQIGQRLQFLNNELREGQGELFA